MLTSWIETYRSTDVPIMCLGCKSDLAKEVPPADALAMLRQYDTGLIEVSTVLDGGKMRMKRSFEYLLKAVLRQRGNVPWTRCTCIGSDHLSQVPILLSMTEIQPRRIS